MCNLFKLYHSFHCTCYRPVTCEVQTYPTSTDPSPVNIEKADSCVIIRGEEKPACTGVCVCVCVCVYFILFSEEAVE
jgi:hypothetical protein